MRKFNTSEFIKLIIMAVIINTIIFFLNKNQVMYYSNQLDVLIVKSFGTLGNSTRELLINIPIITINVVILMYMYSDYVIRDININGKYIFTRTNKRKRWILDRHLEVIRVIILYYFVLLLLYISLGLINGFQISDINNFIKIIIAQYIISVLVTMFNIVATNFIGFKLSVINSFCLIYGLYILDLITIFFSKEYFIVKIISFNPFGASITAWNNSINKLLNPDIEWFNYNIINNNIIYLILSLILLIALMIKAQRSMIINRDLL